MPKKIFATVGTSSITNWLPHDEINGNIFADHIKNQDLDENKIPNCANELQLAIIQLLEELNLGPGLPECAVTLRRLPAEIVTLMRMEENDNLNRADDEIRLFYTDTLDGFIAVSVLLHLLAKFGFQSTTKVMMAGVREGNNGFATLQAPGFFDKLFGPVNPGDCVVFTGGYKALIPPLTWFCLDRNIAMFYLYEGSDRVVCYGNRVMAADDLRRFAR